MVENLEVWGPVLVGREDFLGPCVYLLPLCPGGHCGRGDPRQGTYPPNSERVCKDLHVGGLGG